MTTSFDGTRLVTTDMTLAVVLNMRGFKPQIELDPADEKQARWVLSVEGSDSNLAGLIKHYESGSANVEPRRFMKTLRTVRGELYTLLGYTPKSIR